MHLKEQPSVSKERKRLSLRRLGLSLTLRSWGKWGGRGGGYSFPTLELSFPTWYSKSLSPRWINLPPAYFPDLISPHLLSLTMLVCLLFPKHPRPH